MQGPRRFAARLVTLSLLAGVLGAGAAAAQANAYVALSGVTKVAVLDTATNTVTATIAGTGQRNLSFSRDGAFLYSVSFSGVQVIDLATNTVIANVPTGNIVTAVAQANNGFIYACNNGSGNVSVIDPATYTVVSTLPLVCQTLAATPDGTSIWVSENILVPPFPATMAVIDPATNTFTTFPLGHGTDAPQSIAFTPNGAFAYVADGFDNRVAVIDTATHTEVATVAVGSRPAYVAITADGAAAYVANLTANSVSVIDTATNTVTATVPVGAFPRALAFTRDGASAYVSNFNGNSLSVIDTATKTVTATVPLSPLPWGIAILPNIAPVLTSNNASVAVNEGQTAANTGTVKDANHDTVALTASSGTVVNNGNGTWSWSFAVNDPAQSQTVTITGNDGHGGVSTTTFALVVGDVAPGILSVTNNGPIIAPGSAVITVNAADTTGGNDTLAYSFDCNNDGIFEIGPQAANNAVCTFAAPGTYTVNAKVTDGEGGVTTGSTVVTANAAPPTCSLAVASPNLLSPPNHKFVPIQILGVTSPSGGTVAITVTSIFQDEPVGSGKQGCDGEGDDHGDHAYFPLIFPSDEGGGDGDKRVDGKGVGTATASVRAERSCRGDGRVYHIGFTATNSLGVSCTGAVTVGVPRHKNVPPVDGGALYDSTQAAPHHDHGD